MFNVSKICILKQKKQQKNKKQKKRMKVFELYFSQEMKIKGTNEESPIILISLKPKSINLIKKLAVFNFYFG